MPNISNDYKTQIIQLLMTCPRKWGQLLCKVKKYEHLHQAVLEHSKDFHELNMSTRVYWFLNDITAYPVCSQCHENELRHVRCHPIKGYVTEFCSIKCAMNSKKHHRKLEAKKKDFKEKHGVSCIQQTEEFKDKMRNALSQRTSEEVSAIVKKRKATCLKKYGVDCASKSQEIREKISNSHRQRTEEQKKATVEKIITACKERHGENYKKEIYKDVHNLRQIEKSYEHICRLKGIQACFTKQDYVQARLNGIREFKFKCVECGKEFTCAYRNGRLKHCPYCKDDNQSISNAEIEFHSFVQSICKDEIRFNDRQAIYPFELDVYIPSRKIAFEFDGLYWHSDEFKTRSYHLNKTELCEQHGIHCIHVFENEWALKKDIVKSRISNLLGTYEHVVFARKCAVKPIDVQQCCDFQNQNHIQGAVNASVRLGLFYNDDLISVMTFGKSRFNKKYEWELLRFCNRLGYHIPGAAGKLLKHFERNYKPKSIVSYADRRWSQGKLYRSLNFTFDGNTAPDYWYVDNNSYELLSRIKFQKHKLKGILETYDDRLSETQNMKANGFRRIFDSGNLRFVKIYQEQKEL